MVGRWNSFWGPANVQGRFVSFGECKPYSSYPKNHGISRLRLVVWRSRNPAIEVQTPLFRKVQWFLGIYLPIALGSLRVWLSLCSDLSNVQKVGILSGKKPHQWMAGRFSDSNLFEVCLLFLKCKLQLPVALNRVNISKLWPYTTISVEGFWEAL